MSVLNENTQELLIGNKAFTVNQVDYRLSNVNLTALHLIDTDGEQYMFQQIQAHDENDEFGYTEHYVAYKQWEAAVLQNNGQPVIFEIDDNMVTVIG